MKSNVAYEQHTLIDNAAPPSRFDPSQDDEVVGEAFLDETVINYWFWAVFLVLLCSVIGIIFIPFWLCFGCCLCRQYFGTVKITITRRSIVAESGGVCCHCIPHSVKTILLDRIQDVSISQGCLERCWGIQRLTIETAGQRGPDAGPELSFAGIQGATEFRDAVLSQRHYYVENGATQLNGGTGLQGQNMNMDQGHATVEVLSEIRDTLLRIESRPVGQQL